MQAIQRTRSSALSFIHGIFVVSLVCSVALASAAGGMVTNPSVDGNKVTADIVFPGIAAKLILTFLDVSNLNLANLNLDAELVDPEDPALLVRLPAGVSIPSQFPVLVTIEASDGSSGFSFRRNWTLELVTENLEFSSRTPARLFASSAGGSFQDISVGLGSGSLRVLGVGSEFSEKFLIADDGRPVEDVVEVKHLRLQTALEDAKRVCELAPDVSFLWRTRAVAEFLIARLSEGEERSLQFAEANRSLDKCDELARSQVQAGTIPLDPVSLAVRTMIAAELDRPEEAEGYLLQLRALMSEEGKSDYPDWIRFWDEAEESMQERK